MELGGFPFSLNFGSKFYTERTQGLYFAKDAV